MSAIEAVSAGIITDSRGEKTIEVLLTLSGGISGKASVPHGKSTGRHEAVVVPAEKAVNYIETDIRRNLEGRVFESQGEFDSTLISFDGTPDKSRFGGNTLLGVSVAFAKAKAKESSVPLFGYIEQSLGVDIDRGDLRLYANVINGGQHANSNLRFQEYIVIAPPGPFSVQIDNIKKFYSAVGERIKQSYGVNNLPLGDEGGYALNWQGEDKPFELMSTVRKDSSFGGIDFGVDCALSSAQNINEGELIKLYQDWYSRFKLQYIEDPFPEEDFTRFKHLRDVLPEVLVAGDDLTTTNTVRIEKAREVGAINSIIIKPNQIGTISEALDAVRASRSNGWKVIVSHRSGETMDDWISDFAVGSGADGFKLGSPSRPERSAKYERLLNIEKDMLG